MQEEGSSVNHHLARACAEWRWFFHQAKSEMGIRSSWDPLVQLALTGGAHSSSRSFGTSDREERRRAAVFRHARIEAALHRMPPDAITLIRLTCEADLSALRMPFGDLGNAAHLTEASGKALRASRSTREVGDWLDRLALKHARGRAGPAGLDAIDAIRLGCEDLMESPRLSYLKALGALPQRRAA
jgi:hypothetical protein